MKRCETKIVMSSAGGVQQGKLFHCRAVAPWATQLFCSLQLLSSGELTSIGDQALVWPAESGGSGDRSGRQPRVVPLTECFTLVSRLKALREAAPDFLHLDRNEKENPHFVGVFLL